MTAAEHLVRLLDDAATVVSRYGEMNAYCRFDTGADFAAELRSLRDRVVRKDWSALGSLVSIFAPTGAWDDGVGREGMELANQIDGILNEMDWSNLIRRQAERERELDAENLRQIELALQFRYPPSFWQRREEFLSLSKTEHFKTMYPATWLVSSIEEVSAVRREDPGPPEDFIPFMIVCGQPLPDFYGFKAPRSMIEGVELPVLLWAVHTYVHQWNSGFDAFLETLQLECRLP